jgi:glyoxylase-like metal-dependent hydrolase (beta-lactamase superfamily II)
MEIISNVHLVDNTTSHCYLLVDKELTLIDTGFPFYINKILRYITNELDRKPSELKTIILTHGDIDHSGNALRLKKITGASIAIHEKDADVIARRTARMFPTSRIGFLLKFFNKRMTTPFEVDYRLSEGDVISGLTVIHIPGHSPGSIALYDITRKILFTGDTLSYRDGYVKGPSKRYSMDIQQAFQSIQKYSTLDFNIMLAGHGDPLLVDASLKVKQYLKQKH